MNDPLVTFWRYIERVVLGIYLYRRYAAHFKYSDTGGE